MDYPFGKSRGTPLRDCPDNDLEYLKTYYNTPDPKTGLSRLKGRFGAGNQAMLNEVVGILNERKNREQKPANVFGVPELSNFVVTPQHIFTTLLNVADRVERIESILRRVHGTTQLMKEDVE